MKRKKLENGKWYVSDDGGKTWSFYKDASKEEVRKYEYEQAEKEAGYKESEAYGTKGLERLNRYREAVGKNKLKEGATPAETAKIVKEGIRDLQQHSGKAYNKLVFDYMTERNPQPNIKLANKWKAAYNEKREPTMDDIRKAVKEDKKLSEDDVVDAYKDDKWWFRAVVPRVEKLKKEDYDKKMKELEGQFSIDQDGNKYFRGDKGKHDYVRYITEDEGKTPVTTDGTTPVTTTTDNKQKEKEKGKEKVTIDKEIKRYPLQTRMVEERAPWWLQDIVGVAGAFGDLNRINRYMPWQATPNVHLPQATFYDPTRELGANAEQANIQTQGLAAFTGPQALSARSSQIQGQALKNAADIMGRYNNLNVGLANQLEQNRANILNTASQNQANLDTQLWDKYTILNQQFDNSKAQARQELRKQYINAITNRAKAQALNSLYPNYHTDTASGGFVDYIDTGYMPTPTQSSTADDIDEARKIVERLGVTPDEALRHVRSRKSPRGGYQDEYLTNQGYQ